MEEIAGDKEVEEETLEGTSGGFCKILGEEVPGEGEEEGNLDSSTRKEEERTDEFATLDAQTFAVGNDRHKSTNDAHQHMMGKKNLNSNNISPNSKNCKHKPKKCSRNTPVCAWTSSRRQGKRKR